MNRIFLSTPLRDEAGNIQRLFDSVSAQTTTISCWVIVENGSTDGSKELLARMPRPQNVANLIILNYEPSKSGYALGSKYAEVVLRGFDEIRSNYQIGDEDFVGILDADSFPEPNYYEKLIAAFEYDPELGIVSGVSRDAKNNRPSDHSASWVRGSCRLWRGRCFNQCGYIVGPSADTLSLGLAELHGWKGYAVQDAVFYARDVGDRADFSYYGRSAYFRGNTLAYAVIRSAKYLALFKPRKAFAFAHGYISAMTSRAERLDHPELRAHFRGYLKRELMRRLKGAGQ